LAFGVAIALYSAMGHVLSVLPDTLALLVVGSAFFIAAVLVRRFQPSTSHTKTEVTWSPEPAIELEGLASGTSKHPADSIAAPELVAVEQGQDCVAAEDVCT
jgi:hypothetical protein